MAEDGVAATDDEVVDVDVYPLSFPAATSLQIAPEDDGKKGKVYELRKAHRKGKHERLTTAPANRIAAIGVWEMECMNGKVFILSCFEAYAWNAMFWTYISTFSPTSLQLIAGPT